MIGSMPEVQFRLRQNLRTTVDAGRNLDYFSLFFILLIVFFACLSVDGSLLSRR